MSLIARSRNVSLVLLAVLFGWVAVQQVFFPSRTYAQATANWVDFATIEYNGQTFKDSNPFDGNLNYRTNNGQGCFSEIHGFSTNSIFDANTNLQSAKIKIATEDPLTSSCSKPESSLTLNSTANSKIVFKWIDSGRLQGVSTGSVYPALADNPDVFYDEGSSNICKDSVEVISTSTAIYVDKKPSSGFDNLDCSDETRYNITLGDSANASKAAGTGDVVNVDSPETTGSEDNSCESKSGVMGWIMCPVILMMDTALNWMDTQIQALLEVDETQYNNPGMRRAWANIRNISYAILIPILLVMVIGTALGFDIFSAYTVKKALPRMVIAVIFITLSWYICTFLISFFNIIGAGVLGLLTSPFGENVSTLSLADLFGGSVFTSLIALPFVVGGAIIALAFFLPTITLFVITAFVILLTRQLFIIALIFLAPLAILAWIFPGNDKLWKMWWSTFSKLLIMFPLIMILIAVGRIFAFILNESQGDGADDFLIGIFKLLAYTIPYAAIPLTFKFAGGVFGNLAGMVNDREKGLFDRAKQSRQKKYERFGNQRAFKNAPVGSRRERLNRGLAVGMNAGKLGLNPTRWGGRSGAILSTNSIQGRDAMIKDEDYTWKGNDDLNRDASLSKNRADLIRIMEASGRYANTPNGHQDMMRDVEKVEGMRSKYGNSAFRQATFLQMLGGGTATDVENDDGTWKPNAWRMAASIAGNDTSVLADLVAQGKSAAMGVGRFDQGGASFGKLLDLSNRFRTDSNYTDEQARADLAEIVYNQQGAGTLMHPSMKAGALKNVAPAIVQNVRNGLAKGNAGDKTETASSFASLAALYEGMATNSPEKRDIMQKQVMSQEIDLRSLHQDLLPMFGKAVAQAQSDGRTTITYSEAVESLRSNPQFQQFRKEFETQFNAQAAAVSQQQQAQLQNFGTPPGQAPGPP